MYAVGRIQYAHLVGSGDLPRVEPEVTYFAEGLRAAPFRRVSAECRRGQPLKHGLRLAP